MTPEAHSLRATAVCVVVVAALAWTVAHSITGGFEVWTTEGARRLSMVRTPVRLPEAVMVEGPDLAARRLGELLQRPTLVEFVYTRCETICAAAGAEFQQAQASPDSARIPLLSITFDPSNDSLPALAAYAARMQADPDRWTFARVADPAQLGLLLEAFGITVIPDGRGGYEHNAALLAVDAEGRLVRAFDLGDLQGALRFMAALEKP